MKARLALYKEGKLDKAFALPVPGATIGRDPDNTIELNDPQISRHHARVRADYDMWVLEDMKSTNGVALNGRQVDHAVLKNGDLVGVGPFELVFECVADGAEWPAAQPVNSERRRRTVEKQVKPSGPQTQPRRDP